MQTRFMIVAACAALALGPRSYAGDEEKTPTAAPGQATTEQQSRTTGQPATGTKADPSMQPTEAERQAGGAIGRQPGKTKSVVGTIEKVDEQTLTLKTGTETQELRIDDSTQFTSAEPPFSRDQLAEGAEVRASFLGDSMRATEIHVMSKAAAPQESTGSQMGQQPAVTPSPGAPTGTERSPSETAVPEKPSK